MEKEFFSNNAAIVREVYFDTDILLGADSDEDVGVEEAVNAEDLVPVLSAEEIEWQHAAANDIMNMVIVRVTPVNSDSEDEETMERVASPVVVEAVGDLADVNADSEDEETMERVASPVVVEAVGDLADVNADSEDEETMERVASPVVVEAVGDLADVNADSEDEETMERVASPVVVEAVSDVADTNEATGSADNVVNNSPNLVIAEDGDYVEEAVEGRADVPSAPGPFSEDVTMDDFLPRPPRGSVVFLAFSDW
jgi:hypothetical protein